MRWRIVFASHNAGKAAEVRNLLPGVELLGGVAGPAVEETGSTYGANALLKARSWAWATGLPALADDSGLEVRALGGAPGLHSARVAPSDRERLRWLLGRLEGVKDRRACFVASLAVAFPREGRSLLVQGHCFGTIARAPAGEGGFGYDPLFVPDGGEKTFAEIPPEEKNRLSHRGVACRMLLSLLRLFRPPGDDVGGDPA